MHNILPQQYSFSVILAILFDTYKIVQRGQSIPAELLTIDGIENLVSENKLPREVATFLYKLMTE